MKASHDRTNLVRLPQAVQFQHIADRFAKYAARVLFVAVAIGLLGGLLDAILWQPDGYVPSREPYECPQEPCFSLELDRLRLEDIPSVLWLPVYLLALLLSSPSLLLGIWDCFHGRWTLGARRLLVFLGLPLFFVGMEIVPHLVNPCLLFGLLSYQIWPGVCEYSVQYGGDFADRWHLLDHMLVGGLPMAALYWLALRRWPPQASRFYSVPPLASA